MFTRGVGIILLKLFSVIDTNRIFSLQCCVQSMRIPYGSTVR